MIPIDYILMESTDKKNNMHFFRPSQGAEFTLNNKDLIKFIKQKKIYKVYKTKKNI